MFPYEAGPYDEITITVGHISHAVAYVTETAQFSSPNHVQGKLEKNKETFTATYPKEVYLTLVADVTGQAAEFELEFFFTNNDGDKILAEIEAQERTEQEQSSEVSVEEVVASSTDAKPRRDENSGGDVSLFTMIALVSLVALIIVATLVLVIY